MRARHLIHILGRQLLARGDDGAAYKTLHGFRRFQFRVQGRAVVEDEAVARVVLAAHFLEILQDAAVELVHAVVADLLHVDGGFFAADAARAERHDGLAFQFVLVGGGDGREFRELVDAVIKRVIEGADVHFERVACFHHDHGLARIVDAGIEPALERVRIDGGRAAQFRLDQRHAHGDDFFFQLHQHALVRLLIRQTFLPLQIGQAGIAAHPGEESVDVLARAREKHIDAFRRQQDRALQFQRQALLLIQGAHGFRIVERNEFIRCNIDKSAVGRGGQRAGGGGNGRCCWGDGLHDGDRLRLNSRYYKPGGPDGIPGGPPCATLAGCAWQQFLACSLGRHRRSGAATR